MLAEFDPFKWDWVFALVIVAALTGHYFWRKKKLRELVDANLDNFPTPLPNVKITFWHDEHLAPFIPETALVVKVFDAAKRAWPEFVSRMNQMEFNVWIVRSPVQRVGWRRFGGILWKDIPPHVGIPARDPDKGYGGMADYSRKHGTAYIATFFPNRAPEKLLAHELTHCVTWINNDRAGNHPPEFAEFEKRLIDQLEKGAE
jgi:hypothetical protein